MSSSQAQTTGALQHVDCSGSVDHVTVAELAVEMASFVESMGWTDSSSERPQTPRNLAVSLVLEASELLECFQWAEQGDRQRLRDEMADVFLYLLQLANVTGVDLASAASEKLAVNRTRVWDGAGPRR